MDHRNLDKAMEIFACLITGETVGKDNHRDLYDAYSSQAEVYDILDAVLKKSNLRLYEYRNTLYVTAGDENRVFGYTNDELKGDWTSIEQGTIFGVSDYLRCDDTVL